MVLTVKKSVWKSAVFCILILMHTDSKITLLCFLGFILSPPENTSITDLIISGNLSKTRQSTIKWNTVHESLLEFEKLGVNRALTGNPSQKQMISWCFNSLRILIILLRHKRISFRHARQLIRFMQLNPSKFLLVILVQYIT